MHPCDDHRQVRVDRQPAVIWDLVCVLPSDFSSILDAKDHCTRPTGNAFSAAEGTETFGATTLHRYRRSRCITESRLHIGALRSEFGCLAHNTAVDIADHPPLSPHHVGDTVQDLQRIDAAPAFVGVGEMLADVTEPCSTKESVGTGMCNHIGITVTHESRRILEDDAAQNQSTRRIIAEAMDIETLSDPDGPDVLSAVHDCIPLVREA